MTQILSASLGTPYTVPRSDRLVPVNVSWNLPYDYKEFEIVVIDLYYEPVDDAISLLAPQINEGVEALWMECEHGYVNPRLVERVEGS